MKQLLLMAILLPILSFAQEVQPILSKDYLALITNDSITSKKNKTIDTTNSIEKSSLRYLGKTYSDGAVIRNIITSGDAILKLQPLYSTYLTLTGTATSSFLLQYTNRIPAVQQQYVQGRCANGAFQWQGPETNELFSYGPSVSSLEFDGSNYSYDTNGRLVGNGFGNGQKATIYNNTILRTGTLYSHSVMLQARYRKGYSKTLTGNIKATQAREHTIIISNTNKTDNFSASLEAMLKGFTVGGNYAWHQQRGSNNNRSGFLNRAYRSALLSPVSFSNAQSTIIGTDQRSYSQQSDNPLFLLRENNHSFLEQQHTGSFSLEQKFRGGYVNVVQTINKLQQQSNEGYLPGTAFFENGMDINRSINNSNYLLQAHAEYTVSNIGEYINALLAINYNYVTAHSAINYLPQHSFYRYQRSSNDLSVGLYPSYRKYDITAGLNLINKIYASNTSLKNSYFLPAVSFYTNFTRPFNLRDFYVKIAGSYNRFKNELPVNKSFASYNQVRYPVADALQYLSLTEIATYDNLLPVDHKEYSANATISYKNKIGLYIDWFSRYNFHDIFPVINGNKLQLMNLADHRNRGIELQLNFNSSGAWSKKKISFSSTLSFVTWRSKVMQVVSGYNLTPLAGFSNVHTAIAEGLPLGSIIGNSFLKDADGTTIIGTDGFPLVNNTMSVIGNPVPDFTMKMTHSLSWKQWDFAIDWEWKKGGDRWNGTQALLDYYGRSASSAALRNTSNYIFDGVQLNGSHNVVPVNFYDPSKPISSNRWVRYGDSGVAEDYIQPADCIRLNNVAFSYKPAIKKYLQRLSFTLSASNIIIWSAYKGSDPNQLLNDQPGTTGLDFFNLPSYHSYCFTVSLQF